jgi:polyisoprenoid-binding protein YceI
MNTNSWNIDATHSGINFSIRHMVVSKVRGRFARYSGSLTLDDGDLTRSVVEATIDAASIDTGTPQRDAHLRSPDFFDVERFPELRFRSTRVEKLDDVRYRVVGDLTIRDVTREIALDVEYGGQAKDPWGNDRWGSSPRLPSTARTSVFSGTRSWRRAASWSATASTSSWRCRACAPRQRRRLEGIFAGRRSASRPATSLRPPDVRTPRRQARRQIGSG